ncbi:fungal-specific transcription factor domain-containing protein [Aspergillus pseudonomiae]|uniref:Fungal-specific transcription factor domain-containing protein n=1 Tax=Aspergillus pseudonomiae TaxID=1506151 RepID=A0A5N7CXR0_9EURO|nr:fungal-specific transcription factor domain-containing protein [Aspergillus pseudonomiae]KAE8398986.1 fungal-specific transcription factor domain-containing protein [Aspergillus pseudonomiae]
MSPDTRRNESRQRGKYTTRACEECRRRRAKCDGNKPSCARCSQWRISCQYSVTEDGRRPASKTYVLLLRQRIESLERLLERHGIDARESQVPAQLPLDTKPGRNGDTSSEIDSLAENFKGRLALDESLNFDQDGEMRYFGPTSGRLQFQGSSSNRVSIDGSAFSVSPPDQVSDSYGYIDPIDPITAGMGVPKDVQDHLIDLYFRWEQPWYAVVDEELFRESMNNGGRYWTPLLHNCILALGSRYSDRVDVRSDPDDPNTAGKAFLEEAKTQLHREMERPSLTTIQALGLIGMVYIAMGADAAGWLHHGMANRLSLDMGLNLDPAGFEETNAMTPREIQLRRQIYWTLYCHDKLSSSYTGRICSMLMGTQTTPQGAPTTGLPQVLSPRPEVLVLRPPHRITNRPRQRHPPSLHTPHGVPHSQNPAGQTIHHEGDSALEAQKRNHGPSPLHLPRIRPFHLSRRPEIPTHVRRIPSQPNHGNTLHIIGSAGPARRN